MSVTIIHQYLRPSLVNFDISPDLKDHYALTSNLVFYLKVFVYAYLNLSCISHDTQ